MDNRRALKSTCVLDYRKSRYAASKAIKIKTKIRFFSSFYAFKENDAGFIEKPASLLAFSTIALYRTFARR